MVALKEKLKEFEHKFYQTIEDYDNENPFPSEGEKEKKLTIKREYKEKLREGISDFYLNLYNSAKNMRLKGRAQKAAVDSALDLFFKNVPRENSESTLDLEFGVGTDEALDDIRYNLSKGKANFGRFMENASKSGDPLKYIKSFANTDNVEDALLLHRAIKGRKEIKKVQEYAQSGERDQIEEAIHGVFNKVDGSADALLKLIGTKLDPSTTGLIMELNLKEGKKKEEEIGRLIRMGYIAPALTKCFINSDLEKKGFIYTIYDEKPFIARINSVYSINSTLPVYVINNKPAENISGFFEPRSKKMFAINKEGKGNESVIQHELEHFIHSEFNIPFQYSDEEIRCGSSDKISVMQEYGAILAQLRFSENPDNLWKNTLKYQEEQSAKRLLKIIYSKDDKDETPHFWARIKIKDEMKERIGTDPKEFFSTASGIKSVCELHDKFYEKNIGATYTDIEKMCK